MKITINITLYQCEHCKKKYLRKHACEKHEEFCPSNPDNFKACSGCIFLKEEKVEYNTRYHYNGSQYSQYSNGFRCLQKDQLLYPLKAERLDLPNRFPETFEDQESMPKECNLANYQLLYDGH